jgi:hypothetical protein
MNDLVDSHGDRRKGEERGKGGKGKKGGKH